MLRADGKPVSAYVLAAWERVKDADGAEFAGLIRSKPGKVRTADIRRLALLCRELSRGSEYGGFILSQLDAAPLLAADQKTVCNWLRRLIGLGLMDRRKRGNSLAGRAGQYLWLPTRTRRRSAPKGESDVAARPLST